MLARLRHTLPHEPEHSRGWPEPVYTCAKLIMHRAVFLAYPLHVGFPIFLFWGERTGQRAALSAPRILVTDVPLTQRHIVAIGGGAFLGEGAPRLNTYVLDLTGRARPRVCFIPTAGADGDSYLVSFYRVFHAELGRATDLTLFHRTVENIREFLFEQDLIYVGGGNTASMLAVWRAHGVDTVLRDAWARGIVVGGVSAGAICWFEGGVTDSFGPNLAALRDGLGLLRGSFCPHYDSEPGRRPTYHRLVAEGLPGGYAADDGVGLHFVGTDLAAIVASRPGVKAYRVEQREGSIVETPLEPTLLE